MKYMNYTEILDCAEGISTQVNISWSINDPWDHTHKVERIERKGRSLKMYDNGFGKVCLFGSKTAFVFVFGST